MSLTSPFNILGSKIFIDSGKIKTGIKSFSVNLVKDNGLLQNLLNLLNQDLLTGSIHLVPDAVKLLSYIMIISCILTSDVGINSVTMGSTCLS